jgi:hypothetical protein
MSKDTLNQTASELFAKTAHQVLWANPKGEFFTSDNIGSLSLKPGQKLEKFERPQGVAEDEKVVALNAGKTIEAIQKVDSLKELAQFSGDERKTVKEAYSKKEAELIEAIKVVQAKTETGATDGATGTGTGNEDTDTQK